MLLSPPCKFYYAFLRHARLFTKPETSPHPSLGSMTSHIRLSFIPQPIFVTCQSPLKPDTLTSPTSYFLFNPVAYSKPIMADQEILREYRGKIALITLNCPQKLNALSGEGYYKLARAMNEVAEREDVYITILTGKGRFFSA